MPRQHERRQGQTAQSKAASQLCGQRTEAVVAASEEVRQTQMDLAGLAQ